MMKKRNIPVLARTGSAAGTRGGILLGLAAGFLNGLLGTGGGMVLALGLRRLHTGEDAENMALSTASVLFFSILSTILYGAHGHISMEDILPVLLPALLGGALGSLLLGRLGRGVLDIILTLMLLLSGGMLLL